MPAAHETFSTGAANSGMLSSSLQYVKGVGPVKAGLLARLDLQTIQDLLFFFQSRTKTAPASRRSAN